MKWTALTCEVKQARRTRNGLEATYSTGESAGDLGPQVSTVALVDYEMLRPDGHVDVDHVRPS